MRNAAIPFALALLVLAPAAHAQAPSVASPAPYDRIYPVYVEACGLTQFKRIGHQPGGTGGHAVIYLKGVCRDTTKGYPRLRMCDPGEKDLSDPESGTGVSVDKEFMNANWVAFEGKHLFFDGKLDPERTLDQAYFDRLADETAASGVFKGIKLHPEYLEAKPAGMSEERFIAEDAIGTDYAIRFARDMYCARIPVRREQIEAGVKFLNSLNDRYHRDENYNWSAFSDNCTHTVDNALAAMGIWDRKRTSSFAPLEIFNLAVPSNTFVDLMELGVEKDLSNPLEFYLDGAHYRAFAHYWWIPTEHGVLAELMPAFRHNELFEVGTGFLKLQWPLIKNKDRALRRIVREKRYSDLVENLRYFEKKYRDAKRDLRPLEYYLSYSPNLQTQKFVDFYEAYRQYLDDALEDLGYRLKKASTP